MTIAVMTAAISPHQSEADQVGDIDIGRKFAELHRADEGEDGADQEIDHADE